MVSYDRVFNVLCYHFQMCIHFMDKWMQKHYLFDLMGKKIGQKKRAEQIISLETNIQGYVMDRQLFLCSASFWSRHPI